MIEKGSGVTEKGLGLRAEGSGIRAQRSTVGPEGDTAMTATYVGVIVVEAVILVLLWFLGRVFS